MSRGDPFRTWWRWEVAVYRGDDMVDSGTVVEIAERLGVQKRTIHYHLTPAANRRADKAKDQSKVMRVVRI